MTESGSLNPDARRICKAAVLHIDEFAVHIIEEVPLAGRPLESCLGSRNGFHHIRLQDFRDVTEIGREFDFIPRIEVERDAEHGRTVRKHSERLPVYLIRHLE